MKILNVLHVGVTNRGDWPLEKCNESTGFRPAALCDLSVPGLAAAREKTGLPESACYTDLGVALAEAKVDCAIVCTPTKFHVPMAKQCIAAGVPVLIEKGMAPDWASAQALARATAYAGAVACVAQNYRYNAAERTVRRALLDAAGPAFLGPVHFAQYIQHRVRPDVRTLSYAFASVWDMSCHHFDTMMSWFGPIAEMTAFSWRAGWTAYEHDNNTSAQIRFASGTSVLYAHTHDAARGLVDVQLHGERGALVWRDEGITFNERPREQFGQRPIVPVANEPAEGEADLLRDFHAYITRGVEPGVSVRNNLETMAACEMMVRSITQGRTIRRSELDA